MQMNIRVIYAIEALGEVAKSGKLTHDEIAQRLDISIPYVVNVVRSLTIGGFLEAGKGPSSGYSLVKSLDRITIADLIRSVDRGLLDDEKTDDKAMAAIRRKLRQKAGWSEAVSSVL